MAKKVYYVQDQIHLPFKAGLVIEESTMKAAIARAKKLGIVLPVVEYFDAAERWNALYRISQLDRKLAGEQA